MKKLKLYESWRTSESDEKDNIDELNDFLLEIKDELIYFEEGKETLKKLSKDIELLKNSIGNFLGIEFEIEDHNTSLVIIIKDAFYDKCI